MPVRWIDPSPVLRVERFNSFDEFRPNDVIGGMRSTPLDSSPISASRSILALPDCLLVLQRSFARRMEGSSTSPAWWGSPRPGPPAAGRR